MRCAPSRRPADAGPRKTPKILQEGGGELFGRNPGRSSASSRAFPPPPFGGYLKSEKSAVLRHFSDDFQLFESEKMLQHFCVLTSVAGAMQKRRKWCKYQYFLDSRCTKHCKYQRFCKQSKKNCKLQHFWRVDRKKCWYLHGFCSFKQTWKARNAVNSGVLATFGRQNAGIYAIFCPWRRQTPVNYSVFCTF